VFTNYVTNNPAREVHRLLCSVKLCLLTIAFTYNSVVIYCSSIPQYRTSKRRVLVEITQGTNRHLRKWKVKLLEIFW